MKAIINGQTFYDKPQSVEEAAAAAKFNAEKAASGIASNIGYLQDAIGFIDTDPDHAKDLIRLALTQSHNALNCANFAVFNVLLSVVE